MNLSENTKACKWINDQIKASSCRVFENLYIVQDSIFFCILTCWANVRHPAKSPVFVIADQRVLNLIIERGMI